MNCKIKITLDDNIFTKENFNLNAFYESLSIIVLTIVDNEKNIKINLILDKDDLKDILEKKQIILEHEDIMLEIDSEKDVFYFTSSTKRDIYSSSFKINSNGGRKICESIYNQLNEEYNIAKLFEKDLIEKENERKFNEEKLKFYTEYKNNISELKNKYNIRNNIE